MEQYSRYLKIGKIEGYSYLILLFVAMPLKKFLGLYMAVRVVGTIHGLLFILFVYEILKLLIDKQFTIKQAAIGFGLSLVPFGSFYLKKGINWNP